MKHELRLWLLALQFLTRVPVPAWVGFQPVWLQDCARHFPAVGLLVGGVSAAVLGLAATVLPATVAVWLAIAAGIVLTGAFHEDGLADTADALGGAVDRERALAIMKDSRIGTYGAVALVLSLGLKAALLQGLLQQGQALLALPLVHAWSRLAPLLLMRALPYGGDAEHAKAKPLATQIHRMGLAVALAWCALAGAAAWALGVSPGRLATMAGGLLLLCLLLARWLRRRLGGFTGDTLGAAQQLSELLLLGLLLARTDHG